MAEKTRKEQSPSTQARHLSSTPLQHPLQSGPKGLRGTVAVVHGRSHRRGRANPPLRRWW